MKTFCECKHIKTRHRTRFDKPGTGSCFDCGCSEMKPARYELSLSERRILAKIAETTAIGVLVLSKQLADEGDPSDGAVSTIIFHLQTAKFIEPSFRPAWTIAATVAGREYLQGTVPRV